MLFIFLPILRRESWDHPIYRWEDWGDKWEPGSCAKDMAKEGFESQALCFSYTTWSMTPEAKVQKHGIVRQSSLHANRDGFASNHSTTYLKDVQQVLPQ